MKPIEFAEPNKHYYAPSEEIDSLRNKVNEIIRVVNDHLIWAVQGSEKQNPPPDKKK